MDDVNNLPPGFRFHPTDEELITFYLTRKVADTGFTSKAIVDVDLNKCEPWDLPEKASMGEKEWYFFSMKDRKYPTGLRTNRATEAGYWKTTGKDKEIFRAGVLVGMKKTLVFYRGRAPKGEKSNWVMHEYRLETKHPFKTAKEEWVVCRVFQKSAAAKKPQQSSSSQPSPGSPCDTNSIVNEFGDIEYPSIANSTSGFSNLTTNSYNSDNNGNIIMNMDLGATQLPTLSWPSSLLSSNISMNSWLLKALQLRGTYNQPRDHLLNGTTSMEYSSFLPQGIPALGSGLGSGFQPSSSPSTVPPQPQQEQPFNLDCIW
ncbi:hypothetical protein SLA2020_161910 [Shorea laevis]